MRVAGDARDSLVPAAVACRRAERALQGEEAPSPEPVTITATGAAQPVADRISRTLRAIEETLAGTAAGQEAHGAATAPQRLLAADAFTNPEYARFALKVTLAVMICYFAMNLADWPGIHTCVITCFFVALGTVGETIHKATLRFIGCLVGAGLGLGAILLLMPLMTDLGRTDEERQVHLPPEVFSSLPYLMTIVVLVLVSTGWARQRLGAPAALGVPYVREER